jgi:hypothetical protein
VLNTEQEFFESQLHHLLEEHRGEFVLIKGKTIIGFYQDSKSAYNAGREMFGLQPFFLAPVRESAASSAA